MDQKDGSGILGSCCELEVSFSDLASSIGWTRWSTWHVQLTAACQGHMPVHLVMTLPLVREQNSPMSYLLVGGPSTYASS